MGKRQYHHTNGDPESNGLSSKKKKKWKTDTSIRTTAFERLSQRLCNLFSELNTKCLENKEDHEVLHTLWNSLVSLRLERQLVTHYSTASSSMTRWEAECEWIAETFRTLIKILGLRISHGSRHAAIDSFKLLMDGIKIECAIRSKKINTSSSFSLRFSDFIVKCCLCTSSELFDCIMKSLLEDYIKKYKDIRYYFLISLDTVIQELLGSSTQPITHPHSTEKSRVSRHVFLFLRSFPDPKEIRERQDAKKEEYFCEENKMNENLNSVKIYKGAYVSCWINYLQLGGDGLQVSLDLYKEILNSLPTRLLPFLENPLLISKFFFDAFYHNDITVAVESLSGLFYLLVKSRLAEPQLIDSTRKEFYSHLLSLLQPIVFSLPVRARFLRLLDASLRSNMLSSTVRALFIKKMVSLSLVTAPGASLWLLAVALRLLQRGGAAVTKFLILRNISPQTLEEQDPLVESNESNNDEDFPSLNDAVLWKKRRTGWETSHDQIIANESLKRQEILHCFSLWELRFVQLHWNPCVSALGDLFNENLFKVKAERIDTSQFLNSNTSEIFFYHLKPLVKKEPGSSDHFIPINFEKVCNEKSPREFLNLIRAGTAC